MSAESKMKASFNFNTFLFFLLLLFLMKKKNNQGQTLWGRIALTTLTKIQEAAIISVNICAQKEGSVRKTTYIA